MNWYEIKLEIAPEDIEKGELFFQDCGILSLNIDDPTDMLDHQAHAKWDYIDESLLARDLSKAYIKVYAETEEERDAILKAGEEKGFSLTWEVLKAEDWENGWKKYYSTFRIGEHTVIVPAWEEYHKKEGENTIILDSGMAFGTGTHETTRMCIEQIEQIMKSGMKVLDIGTGSGILSICAAQNGAAHVDAVDIDELSVKISKENIALNGLTEKISVKQGDLLDTVGGTYDIIIANIVADVIISLFGSVKPFLKPEGLFLVSGIILERKQEVADAAVQNGFFIKAEKTDGGWASFLLGKQ